VSVTAARRCLPALALAVLASGGCGQQVHVGSHDGGPISCAVACAPGSQCVCGTCRPLDAPAVRCDPPCDVARAGDLCAAADRTCPIDACSSLVCRGGVLVAESAPGCGLDAGPCTCPPPPVGCAYETALGDTCCGRVVCGERCGRAFCGPGTTCCNDSCSLCTGSDLACTAIACSPDCTPQRATGDGPCLAALGVAWNGRECATVSGCNCVGEDCPALFGSIDECNAYFGACVSTTCGTIAGLSCRDDQFCRYHDSAVACGGADGTGSCEPRPNDCSAELAPVCGCDGITHGNRCLAERSGTDVAHLGACVDCGADDATPIGDCTAVIGARWTGSACDAISGCECTGSDCAIVSGRSDAECVDAHAECVSPEL
jgi:hypothetical protein